MDTSGAPNITVRRLRSRRQREEADEVWSTCRFCGDDIPVSDRRNAYCDTKCKKRRMRQETEGL